MAEYTKADLKAGIVIIVCVLLGCGLLVFVSDYQRFMAERYTVEVVFEDAQGLKDNSPVQYAGKRVGTVKMLRVVDADEVEPAGPVGESRSRSKITARKVSLVYLEMEKRYTVRCDDVIHINKTLTGGLTVKIEPTGQGKLWEEGDSPIRGTEYPGFSDYAKRIEGLLNEVETAFKKVKPRAVNIFEKVEEIVEGFRKTFSEKEQQEVRDMLADLQKSAEHLRKTTERVEKMMGEDGVVPATADDIRQTVQRIDKVLQDSREDLQTSIKNVKEASSRISEVSQKATALIGDLNVLVDRNRDDLGDFVAHLKRTSSNLLAWSADVRRHPWVLLRKPDEDEIVQRELGYTALQLKEGLATADQTVERLLDLSRQEKMPEKEARQLTSDLKRIMDEMRALQQKLERKVD